MARSWLCLFRPLVSDLAETSATTEVPWQELNPSFRNLFQTWTNVPPSSTRLRRIPSRCASTFVTTTLVAISVPAIQAMSFRRTGIPARVRSGLGGRDRASAHRASPSLRVTPLPALLSQPSAAASCSQSRRATSPAWSTPGPTRPTYAATTASG